LRSAELGSTHNVHAFGANLLCGQPSAEEFAEAKRRGITTVITVRRDGEVDWDEAELVREMGLEFYQIGFDAPDTLSDAIFDQTLQLLADPKKAPVMLHCATANRVGAIWFAHRVLHDGLAVAEARKEAVTVGMRTPGYEARVLDYIARKQAERPEESVRPGINDRFVDPNLDLSEWLGRFEIESREVYAARASVLKACGIKPGFRVVDVGAGTGFYSRLFSQAVGENGWVYAVDISPKFLEHINGQSREEGVNNVTCVLGSDRSIALPPHSVDVVFACDTYHHFEYPQATLASIHRALKPGGTLVVIDFDRIPGKSSEFIMGHVRAGKEVFRDEIVSAGFTFTKEVQLPEFKENYLLRFEKD
jgi:SAM-dependent methyltransferase/protein tyrosine phosphatase (PTP) superfamily phosphohydrolase (DUF442 family)